MRRRPALLALAVAAAAGVAFLWPGPVSAKTDHPVTIQGFAYSPNTVTVAPGDTVTWTNFDSGTQHSATDDNGAWDTGKLSTNQSHTVTFATVGTFRYHCSVHPTTMSGTVVVGTATTTTVKPTTTSTSTTTTSSTTTTTAKPTTTTSSTTTSSTSSTTIGFISPTSTEAPTTTSTTELAAGPVSHSKPSTTGPGALAALLLFATAGGTALVLRRGA